MVDISGAAVPYDGEMTVEQYQLQAAGIAIGTVAGVGLVAGADSILPAAEIDFSTLSNQALKDIIGKETNAKLVGDVWGSNVSGAAKALAEGIYEIPPGLTRVQLQAYRELAMRAPGNPFVQALRIQIIDRILGPK